MSKEQPSLPDPFGFTDKERLWDRIGEKRFQAILADPNTLVHEIELSTNNYGEFLFVTVSRPHHEERLFVTFWGAGFHEYRERWLHQEWRWHLSYRSSDLVATTIEKEAAKKQVQERHTEIRSLIDNVSQSERGKLFEMLADLTDEDGAYSEMEDWGDLFDFDEF